MLIEQILSFFSTSNSYSTTKEELHDIRNYQNWDEIRDINRKKTATFDTLMTNTFESGNKVAWCIVFLENQNMKKWLYQSKKKRFEELVQQTTISAQKWELGSIKTKIISQPPTIWEYQQEKQIIISDFFWEKDNLQSFLQAAQKWVARGIIPQLFTETGNFFHPLPVKYPHYFFSEE